MPCACVGHAQEIGIVGDQNSPFRCGECQLGYIGGCSQSRFHRRRNIDPVAPQPSCDRWVDVLIQVKPNAFRHRAVVSTAP